MSPSSFQALVLTEVDGKPRAAVQGLSLDDLPPGDVVVRVACSSLNYKDGLAITGQGKIIRRYPMVPGIDFAGTVESSTSPLWHEGDRVILTGWGVGERHFGGYAERARVKGEWLVPLPAGMEPVQAMGIGTAGLTAMLCVMALEEKGLSPAEQREVLVTGAAGGVGGVAVAILSGRGYRVVASTGRQDEAAYLSLLGAKQVIGRLAPSDRPLESERWAAVVDSVGGVALATALKAVVYGGSVAACGLAGGSDLPTSVLPFILRGVSLLGVDSVQCPQKRRLVAWERLAKELPRAALEQMIQTVPLSEVPHKAAEILLGKVRGRVVVVVP